MERFVGLRASRFYVLVAAGGFTILEDEPEDRPDAGHRPWSPVFGEDLREAVLESLTEFLETGVGGSIVAEQSIQCRGSCGHGHWVSRQGARLIYRSERRQLFHEFAASSVGTHGHSAADDLAVSGKVGFDAVEICGAIRSETEAGNDFIED